MLHSGEELNETLSVGLIYLMGQLCKDGNRKGGCCSAAAAAPAPSGTAASACGLGVRVGGARAPGPRLQKLAYECLAKAELGELARWEPPPPSAM